MPRRADGTWEDKDGNVVYRTDPHDTGVDRSKATYKDGFWYDNATGQKIPNKNDLPQRVPGTKAGTPGSTAWPDGTPVTPEETAEINKQASSSPTDPGWLDVILGPMTGGIGTVISGAQGQWLGNPPGMPTGHEPSEGAPNYGITGFADPSGATNNFLPANAPGAELPTAQADEDRKRMADYLAQLQGQAATGSGAWEGQLARATQQGSDAASALGQSAAGLDPMAVQRNIGNATAGVQQRAAGQAETLRAQTQQQAQQQLADINAAQASLDAQQAAEQAAARQGRREANKGITDEANRVNTGIYSGAAQAFASLLSNGGPVPGKAKVFGDDSANDTVPAMLSPGEIVLPRSVTQSGNPEAAAAAFVQAVKEHHGRNFDEGGKVPAPPPARPVDPWATKPDSGAKDALPVLANDPTVTAAGNAPFMGIGTPQEAASVRNGGLLDTTAYNASRDATLGSTQAFLDAFGGRGPSVAPSAMQAATDANIAGALSAQTGARGAGRGAAAGLIGGQAAEELSSAGGKAASTAANEAARGGQSYAAAIQRQRQMDLAFALAQQQAAWRNSMLNAGIGLQNQAAVRGILGGAGQAFAAGADALKNWKGEEDLSSDPWASDSAASATGDWESGSGGGSDLGGVPSWASDSGTAYAAHGGEIRARDRAFTRACGFADGGDVSWSDKVKRAFSSAADAVKSQMQGRLEDEAIMRAKPDPRYSREQVFDIETRNPVKLAALDRLSMDAAMMPGAIGPNQTMLQGLVAKLKDKGPISYGTTKQPAWIGDLYEQMSREGYEMTRPEFEAMLLDAHRAGTVNLSRQDLVTKAMKDKIAASEVKGEAGSQFHRADVPDNFADGGEVPEKRSIWSQLWNPDPESYAAVEAMERGKPLPEARPGDAARAAAADRQLGDQLVRQYLGPPPEVPVEPGPSSSPSGMVAQMAPAAQVVPGTGQVVPEPVQGAARPPDRSRSFPVAPGRAPLKPDNYALEQQAATDTAAAHEEAGRAQAEALVGAQKALEQAAIDQKESRARAQIAADADMARILEARQAVASSSSSIDPGRWWASRSTPGKIAAAIGLALGAIGAGNDGVNRAVGIIQNAIGRDLEAQKAEHEIRLRKGQLAVDSATSIYALHRQLARDDIASADASKATALEIAKNQVDLATARASSPLAKAQGQMLSAQLGQKRDEHDAATKQRSFDNWIKREDVETRRLAAGAAAGKVDKTNQALVQSVEAENTTIHKAGTKLLQMIKEHGTGDLTGPANAQMRQLVDAMATASAKLKDPTSVARESEVAAERKNIFDPGLSVENLKGGAEEKIRSYMANAQTRRDDAYRIRGITAPGEAASQAADSTQVAEAKAWLQANPNSPKAAAVRAKLQQMGAM